MKVLNAREIGGWTMRITCNCKAHLEIAADDFRIGSFGGNAWEKGTRHPYVKCPRCGENIAFRYEDLPQVALEAACKKRDS